MCGHNLSRGRRRRRAHVGDKISDGEISFVTHGRDNRNHGSANRACDHLLVESPEVFDGSAAAAYDHYINGGVQVPGSHGARVKVVEELNGADDLLGRAVALDPRGREQDVHGACAPGNYVEDVANRGAAR